MIAKPKSPFPAFFRLSDFPALVGTNLDQADFLQLPQCAAISDLYLLQISAFFNSHQFKAFKLKEGCRIVGVKILIFSKSIVIFSLQSLGLNIDIVYYVTIGGGRMAIIGNIVIILFQLDPS